ncbi:MAG: hypothetical protein JJV95_00440 [Sulfurospirillum sp.]|nr:hypothetical protein [Sulfurospirillum sp.]MBL0702435.1 hypothetical protein [Sulfurospirillum sp.]
MKSPRGFGRNYFSFSSILAYSVQNRLDAKVSSVYSLLLNRLSKENKEVDEDDPPLEILETACFATDKPCRCNCFYKLRTKLAIFLYHYIPRCPYCSTYFTFRRSGVHPPYINYSHN